MAGETMDPLLNLLHQRPREDWQWRFEPDAPGHSAVNAVALCNLALLAYSTAEETVRFLSRWRLSLVAPLGGANTQGFVARRGDAVFVSFRGTEPTAAADWLSDLNYHCCALAPGSAGLVHGGFAGALGEVKEAMVRAVGELPRDVRLFVTGHSLGGALAVLAAAVLHFHAGRPIAGLYTYGQPRVGDPVFSKALDDAFGAVAFRYANDRDIVPHVPPERLPPGVHIPISTTDFLGSVPSSLSDMLGRLRLEHFAHAGQLKLFLPDGRLTADPLEWKKRELLTLPRILSLIALPKVERGAELRALLGAERRVLDHDPLSYLKKLEALAP